MLPIDLETLFSSMASLPKRCIYGLVNEANKTIQIYSTKNILAHLAKLINELNDLNNRKLKDSLKDIKFIILDDKFRDDQQQKVRYSYYRNYYRKLGYSFFSDHNPIDYKVKKSLRYKRTILYYLVELQNKRKDTIVVGAFRNHKDAEEFINLHYLDGVKDIIISDNEYTKLWIND